MPVSQGEAVSIVNAYRAAHGLGPVSVSSSLAGAAQTHALAMGRQDKIGHNVGGRLPRRVAAAGYDWGALAENLGAGYASLGDAMNGWKASPGHNKNLLNPLVTEMGIAAARTGPEAKHANYWTMILGAPRQEPGITAAFR
jgi:uncharacterized protein YkwD